MKVNAMICSNGAEIEKANRLGLKEIPIPEWRPVPFMLHFHIINWAYRHPDGSIRIHVTNQEVTIQYEEEVWTKLEAIFGK